MKKMRYRCTRKSIDPYKKNVYRCISKTIDRPPLLPKKAVQAFEDYIGTFQGAGSE